MAVRKVRWTTRCAGGCGDWLPAGRRATFAYGHYWCENCVRLRRRTLVALGK